MNDPNGCVFHRGVYHLYFQYHPYGLDWGPMHWGHAVSTDLLHWSEKAIALYPHPDTGTAFSGSAIVDRENRSGLFGPANEAGDTTGGLGAHPNEDSGGIVAFYTGHHVPPVEESAPTYVPPVEESAPALHVAPGQSSPMPSAPLPVEHQCIAVSHDDGAGLTPYDGNPILREPGLVDFRDPKVFRHEATDAWVMVVAGGDHVAFYRSTDLINWRRSARVVIEGIGPELIYECPDLITFPATNPSVDDVESTPAEEHWMLAVSLLERERKVPRMVVAVFGSFDGYSFEAQEPFQVIDHGGGFYAMQSWSHLPDTRRVWIGWLHQWTHADPAMTIPWRGCMSIPRELSVAIGSDGGRRLRQLPVREWVTLREESCNLTPGNPGCLLPRSGACRVSMQFSFGHGPVDTPRPLGTPDPAVTPGLAGTHGPAGTHEPTGTSGPADTHEPAGPPGSAPAHSRETRLVWSNAAGEALSVIVDGARGRIAIDRSAASGCLFSDLFPPVVEVDLSAIISRGDDPEPAHRHDPTHRHELDLLILFDRSVIELFAVDGQVVLSTLYFTREPLERVAVEGNGVPVTLTPLRSIYEDRRNDAHTDRQ